MAAATNSIELQPSGPPRRLARPEGFKTASISVGFSGDAIRLLASEGSADALVARVEQPGWASFPRTRTDNEYCRTWISDLICTLLVLGFCVFLSVAAIAQEQQQV